MNWGFTCVLGMLLAFVILLPPYWLAATHNAVNAPTISDLRERYRTSEKKENRPYEAIIASQNDLKDYLRTQTAEYGFFEEIYEVIKGESGFNPSADNGISVGISQFTLKTWLENCSDKDERKDPYKSLDCMIKLWKKGEQWRWDVWCMKYGREHIKCKLRGF